MAEAFEVGVSEELIVVRQPAVHFYAIYAMASDPPQLKLTRRAPTKAPKLRGILAGSQPRRASSGGLCNRR